MVNFNHSQVRLAIVIFGLLSLDVFVFAQPYSAQLKTDPDVGNVRGINTRGRPLKSDPDQGVGWSFDVHPVVRPRGVVFDERQSRGRPETKTPQLFLRSLSLLDDESRDEVLRSLENREDIDVSGRIDKLKNAIDQLKVSIDTARDNGDDNQASQLEVDLHTAKRKLANLQSFSDFLSAESDVERGLGVDGRRIPVLTQHGIIGSITPFDSTAGIRNFGAPSGPPPFSGANVSRALGMRRTETSGIPQYGYPQLFHQPLIQIKVRVVEVARNDSLQVSSVLDYISHNGQQSPLFSANNVNNNRERTTGSTRFPTNNAAGLIGIGPAVTSLSQVTGTGMLVNLTSHHLNYIAEVLATEFGADIVTAPEVVTLNGQNVEFVAGAKSPFPLGQNVVQENSSTIQQFFYKHVGSYVSVTPTIVNWGKHAEGRGQAAITANDISDWSAIVEWLKWNKDSLRLKTTTTANELDVEDLNRLERIPVTAEPAMRQVSYQEELPPPVVVQQEPQFTYLVPIATRTEILDKLNEFPRMELLLRGLPVQPIIGHPCENCNWRPEDCTIDLSIVVRLSEGVPSTIALETGRDSQSVTVATSEKNVRAVANVIQVKSGHGVVMAGVIGERDIEAINKVPVLGDIPVVGFAFRSKATNRQKTELLVFVEANVLDPRPEAARAQSYEDFVFGEPYVSGHFLDNPLEYGMYRAGFGTYLPPHSAQEKVFWERLGRKVKKAATEIDDAFE